MGIQLVGDPEVLRAVGLEPNTIPNGESLSRVSSINPDANNVPVVSIPDLRVETKVYSSSFSDKATNPGGGSTETISSLETIRKAIEKSYDKQAGTSANKADIRDLKNALDSPKRILGESNLAERRLPEVDHANTFSECYLSKFGRHDAQIQPIVDSILNRFPENDPNIIAFAGSEDNEQLGAVVAQTAAVLGDKTDAKILVVDCDLGCRSLTEAFETKSSSGLLGLNLNGVTWRDTVVKTSLDNVDFVSTGAQELSETEAMRIVSETIRESRGQYRFVLVNVGDAHGLLAETWSPRVSGTMLLVSMDRSNQEVAKSAVAQLNAHGARLLGCVVSERAPG